MGPQLQLVRVAPGRAVVRHRPPNPLLRLLAEHVFAVRGYHPYPELLLLAAEALDAWLDAARGDADLDEVRAKVVSLPPYVHFAGASEVTVGEVMDHLELAAFAAGRGMVSGLALVVAARAWGA